MKLKAIFLIVLLSSVANSLYSQIDSLDNRVLYNWKLNPYDLSIELEEMDTSLTSFQNFNPLLKNVISSNYLGNLGTAAQSKIYYDRRKYETGFIFSEPYSIYFHLPQDQLYFNTKRQFTLLNYSTGGPKEESEQVLGVLHTQNVTPEFNFGFDYDLISSIGRYQNQELKQNLLTVFSSFRRKGYHLHTNFGLNKFKGQENGGIDSLHYLGDNDYKDRMNIPVKLNDARTQVANVNFYLAHEYEFGRTRSEVKERSEAEIQQKSMVKNLNQQIYSKGDKEEGDKKKQIYDSEKTDKDDHISDSTINDTIVSSAFEPEVNKEKTSNISDTIKIFKPSGFSISHELIYNSDLRKFIDDNLEETENFYTYRDIYIDSASTYDEVRQKQFGNKLALNYKYSDKLSVRFAFYSEQINYDYNVRPDTLSVDTVINTSQDTSINYSINDSFESKFSNSNVSFYLKALLFNHILFDGYAEYYISGYKRKNSRLDFKFAYILRKDLEVSFEGEYSNKRPDFFHENYESNNFKWSNESLNRIEEWDAGFAIRSAKYKFNAKAQYGQITNYLYLDTLAYVNQKNANINIMSADLYKHFKLGPINSITRFVYQRSTNDSLLNLPEFNLYQSLYFERLSVFPSTGGKLLWQVGVDFRYNSSYYADGYMPPLGLFYRQFDHKIEDYQCLDLFINVNIKRARIYLKYSYLNSVISEEYYFTGPYYPAPEPIFKFGLAWTFYD